MRGAAGAWFVLGALCGCADVVGARFDEAHPRTPAAADAGSDAGAGLSHQWSLAGGDAATQHGKGIAPRPGGGVVVVGGFQGSLDLVPGQAPLVSAGFDDIFVLALDATGTASWARRFGSDGSDNASSVTVLPTGEIVIGGTYGGEIDFGGDTLAYQGEWDAFIAKLAPDGTPIWGVGLGGALPQFGYGSSADDSGNVAIVGAFRGTMDLDAQSSLTAKSPEEDAYVALYDAAGALRWARSFSGAGHQIATGVAFDPSGNLIVCGTFRSSVDFGGSTLSADAQSQSFVLELDDSGALRWVRSLGPATVYGTGHCAASLSDGDVIAATGLAGTQQAEVDVIAARLRGGDGSELWTRRFGDAPNAQSADAIAIGDDDQIYVVGTFAGAIDFGADAFASAGLRDGFLLELGGAGETRSARAMSGGAEQLVNDVASGPSDQAYVVGSSQGTSDWGGAPLYASGDYDLIVAAYAK
jgi:hypothetical protein